MWPVASSHGAQSLNARWMRAYMIDLLALAATAALTVRFWCGTFGVDDPLFVSALIVAALAEVTCRLAVARREWRRPQTFCDDRRFDLIAGISLGTGPWPITQMMGLPSHHLVIYPMAAPWLRLAGSSMVLACAAWRVATVLGSPLIRRRSIRQLRDAPRPLMASLMILQTGRA
jgi:hypothetical protein